MFKNNKGHVMDILKGSLNNGHFGNVIHSTRVPENGKKKIKGGMIECGVEGKVEHPCSFNMLAKFSTPVIFQSYDHMILCFIHRMEDSVLI